MKRGFTLIELLAVITLIGVLAIVGAVSVTRLITSSKEKTYQKQVKNIELAAKTWATNNTELIREETDFEAYVNIEDLKRAGLLENIDIVDPRTDKLMNGCVKLTYNTDTKKYKYQYTNTCGNQSDYPTIEISYNLNENNFIEVSQASTVFDIANDILVNAYDKNGNAIEVEGPTITRNGKSVDSIVPNKVGDIYVLTYVASQNNFKTSKSIRLRVVDTTPPEIFLNGNEVTDQVTNSSIQLNGEFTPPTLTVTDNSGENIEIQPTGKLNVNNIGEYTLVYTATDSSKNKSTYKIIVEVKEPNKLSFSLKKSAPSGTDGWYKVNPTITVTNLKYNDQPISSATCKYRINSGAYSNITSSNLSFNIANEGSNINVEVSCSYAETEYTQNTTLKVDKTSPTCTTSGGSTAWKNSNVTIKGTCSDSGSGCAGTNPTHVVTASGTNIGPGANGGTATVYDKAGNSATCPANQSVNIDKIAPTCTVTSSHNGWTNQNVTVTGICSDAGGSGCDKTSVSETYITEMNAQKKPALLDSNAVVEDNAGNKTNCGTALVQIDKTAPYAPYITKVEPWSSESGAHAYCWCNALIGTTEKCNGVVECRVNVTYWAGDTVYYGVWDRGGSGIDRKVWAYNAVTWNEYDPKFKIQLTLEKNVFCEDFDRTAPIYVKYYDKAGNTSTSNVYLKRYHENGMPPDNPCSSWLQYVKL